jgi:hypothetical protein
MSTRSETLRAQRSDVVAAAGVALFVAIAMAITAVVVGADTATPSTTTTEVATRFGHATVNTPTELTGGMSFSSHTSGEPPGVTSEQAPRLGDTAVNTPTELTGGVSFAPNVASYERSLRSLYRWTVAHGSCQHRCR